LQASDFGYVAAAPAAYVRLLQPAYPSFAIDSAFVLAVVGLAALSAGGIVFVATLLFGGRVARRAFRVVLMADEDYPEVQGKVRLVSSRLGIKSPKVGLVEDLRPNAFSLGRGEEATIVFSLGILGILEGDELEAVISHELAHIKDGDFAFKALTNALMAISFFNPLSYFTASAALKEREMLADERGASVLAHPYALASALVKVGISLREFPSEGRLMRLAAATFLISSFEHRSHVGSRHPAVEARAWNVLGLGSRSMVSRRKFAAVLVASSVILLAGVVASFYLVDLQAHMLQVYLPKAPLAFSYASQNGVRSVGLRATHSGANVTFPRFGRSGLDGDQGDRLPEMVLYHSSRAAVRI